MGEKYTCSKCMKTMDEKQFYTLRDGKKTDMCKKCLTMHVNAFKPDTFLWILEKMDIPYIESEWNVLRDKDYAKDPRKFNGGAVFGKYLSKMKLVQFSQYRWADTEKIKENTEKQKAIADAERIAYEESVKRDFEDGKISEAEYKTIMSTETQYEEHLAEGPQDVIGANNAYNEDYFMKEEELIDPAKDLTQEDKVWLAMKWGRLYRPSEWVELEKNYREMTESFDIQDADTTNTLILLCKTNLKMNQAIDNGDVEGFQKLSRVSDSLRKSAKFTAAQNKEDKSDYVDSVGELVAMCEREGGFIPRYPTDIPQDKVDLTLKDSNKYVYKLVTQDLGFGQQIEDALKKIQIQKELEQQEEAELNGEDVSLEDFDVQDYHEELHNQKESDKKIYESENE